VLVVAAGVVAGLSGFIGASSPGVNTGVVTAVTIVLVMAIVVGPMTRVRLLSKMEMANKMALAPADAGAHARAEGTDTVREQRTLAKQDLVVKYKRGRVLRLLGLPFGMACLLLAYALLMPIATADRLFLGFCSAMLIAFVVMGAAQVLRWGLGRPILTLDAEGVHMPRYSYTLPWADLAEVRLIPVRNASRRRRQPAAIVAFMPADPEATVRELRAKGGPRRFEKSCRLYGTPLTIADRLMDQTADQITAAASALAPVPVRRY
jgi:hypothetical protein